MKLQSLIWVLWPAFIAAGVAEALFFTIFDPEELPFFGTIVGASRITTYSVGFFLFWAFAAFSSTLTCFFQRGSAELNRCPLPPTARPLGCPKRSDENASCR